MTPASGALGVASFIILILAALFLLFGCVHVVQEPALPYPERPGIQVVCHDGACCMTRDDAVLFLKWLQKLNEFETARERLLKD